MLGNNEYSCNSTDCMITVGNENINHIDLTKITYMIHPKYNKKFNVIGRKDFIDYKHYCDRFESLNEESYVLQLEGKVFSFYCKKTNGGSWIFVNE